MPASQTISCVCNSRRLAIVAIFFSRTSARTWKYSGGAAAGVAGTGATSDVVMSAAASVPVDVTKVGSISTCRYVTAKPLGVMFISASSAGTGRFSQVASCVSTAVVPSVVQFGSGGGCATRIGWSVLASVVSCSAMSLATGAGPPGGGAVSSRR